jgi:excisionase family DNA binding protein
MKRQFMNIEQVADYIQVSKSFLYKKVANNEIPYHKLGSRTLFDLEEINSWVKCDGKAVETTKIDLRDYRPFLD